MITVPDLLTDLALDERVRAEHLLDVLPPGAAFARRTAARLWGFDVPPHTEQDLPQRLEIVVPAGVTPLRRPGVTCYAADLEHDVVELAGLPVTSPLRTAMDIARFAPRWVALPMLDVAARKGLFSPVQALVRLDDLPYERGVGIARGTAALVDAGAESPMESVTRVRLDDAGFPRPETQILVPRPGCLPYRLDLGWRRFMLALEYDGREHHSDWEAQLHDRERRLFLESLGWTIFPLHSGHVFGRRLDLEHAVGDFLGLAPTIRTRRW